MPINDYDNALTCLEYWRQNSVFPLNRERSDCCAIAPRVVPVEQIWRLVTALNQLIKRFIAAANVMTQMERLD